jgi:hypothetical protein
MMDLKSNYPNLDRLIDFVRNDAEELSRLPLSPDGRYQTRVVTLEELTGEVTACLARGFAGKPPDDFPMLYCSWGKCRVGSTALTNLFGVAGLLSYYQPVKTIARHRLLGNEPDSWSLPSPSEGAEIYTKEMAGPYLIAETLFNPLKCLINAGYPARKLHLLVLDRNPYKSLASWLLKWSDKLPANTLVEHFVLSSLNAHRMKKYAADNGIPVTHFVYEASRKPAEAIQHLFKRLGLSSYYHAGVVDDWNEMGALASEKSRIIFPDEPPIYVVPGLHSSETRYLYKDRDASMLDSEQREVVRRAGLPGLYADSVHSCVSDLGLDNVFCEEALKEELT